MKVTIIVPAYNEAACLPSLIEEFDVFMKTHKNYEVLFVDDGSDDGTDKEINNYKRAYLKYVRHRHNQGKTQAIITGCRKARGDVVVIFDADLQYSTEDIPKLVGLIENGIDVATGWKQGRYEKKFVSGIYNAWARRLFGLTIHDMNSIKAFRKEVIENIALRKEWHRYIVALAHDAGYRIGEVKVKLRPRQYGIPKYQRKSRILVGVFDLLAVKFQLTFMQKPLLYFGTIGLGSITLGFVVGIVAMVLRLIGYGYRPLLYLVILTVISGILFFSLGLIGESIRAILDRLEKRDT